MLAQKYYIERSDVIPSLFLEKPSLARDSPAKPKDLVLENSSPVYLRQDLGTKAQSVSFRGYLGHMSDRLLD
jgi:hypothetical protein